MYEAFFGLTKRPFASVPCPDQYYAAATIEAARQTLARCIRRAEGPAMVIGPAGTGKTLLCRVLAEEFEGQFQVVVVTGQGLDTRRASCRRSSTAWANRTVAWTRANCGWPWWIT